MSFHVPEQYRVAAYSSAELHGNNGVFSFKFNGERIYIIASDGGGWEHVRVSLVSKKIPSWHIMCLVKGMFWDEEDCVIQYHPPASEYVNNHKGCLHLWRPIGVSIPMPPSEFVGIK